MSMRIEWDTADSCEIGLYDPMEAAEYLNETIAGDSYALVLGGGDGAAMAIEGTRAELLALAARITAELAPACDLADGCGAAAGQTCEPGCPSLATDH